MDHRERFLAYFEGEVPDRTPIFLRDFTLGLDNLGCRTTDLLSETYDSELSSRSVLSFGRLTGQDAVIGCVHTPAFLVDQFGGKMKVTEYGIPSVIENPLSSPGTLDGQETAIKGLALKAVESYHLTRRDCGGLAVVGNVTGPLTKASVLMGMDVLCLAMEQDIGFVKEVIELGIEATYSYLELIRDDIDVVFFASASDSPTLFGNDVIKDFSISYLKDMVVKVHSFGLPVIHHPHGDYYNREMIDSVLSADIDCFNFAENANPSSLCEMVDDRCVIMGGTEIVPTLFSGTREQVISETERYMGACSGSRYIFSCSCSLQRGTPIEPILTMCDAARNFKG